MASYAVILDTNQSPPLVIVGDAEGQAFVTQAAAQSWVDSFAPSVAQGLLVVPVISLAVWLNG